MGIQIWYDFFKPICSHLLIQILNYLERLKIIRLDKPEEEHLTCIYIYSIVTASDHFIV